MTTEVRPWGIFENLLEEIDYKVKRIIISPNQSISLQYHFHREEYWIVVEGDGSSWQFIQSELEYLQNKHANFFENWEYPNG